MGQEPRGRVTRLKSRVAHALGRTAAVSDDERIALTRRAATAHLERGEINEAEDIVRAAVAKADLPRKNADLLHDVASEIVALGQEPSILLDAIRADLRLADNQLSKGRHTVAAESFARALKLAFDRNLHFDSTDSPMARDPRGFTAPLRESAYAQAVRAPRGRMVSTGSTTGAAKRITVATRGNENFLPEILAMLEEHPEIVLKHVDFADNKRLSRGIFKTAQVTEEILTGKHGMAKRAEEELRPYLDETDVLFVEWCSALAVLTGLVDPRDTRVIVRLHSYEAFSPWPHLLDVSRIDDMLFVSEHLRDFAVDVVPGLSEENAPRLHVLPLAKDLRPYVRPKADDARFNLALVGWGSVAKDPLWAFEVVRRVREQDDRYRLLLVGPDFAGDSSAAATDYAERLQQELTQLEQAGAVRRLGPSDDVPSVLTDAGVILSTSVRESFHAGLVEGAASGAVPVVRDWPFFAGRPTSARTLFPADWVVETPEQAARRILGTTADADAWREAGAAASKHALATWDWEVVKPGYERLLLG